MRDLPIIFPISFAILIIMIFFTGAYAIAEDAAADRAVATSSSVTGAETQEGEEQWVDSAALFVCPFH